VIDSSLIRWAQRWRWLWMKTSSSITLYTNKIFDDSTNQDFFTTKLMHALRFHVLVFSCWCRDILITMNHGVSFVIYSYKLFSMTEQIRGSVPIRRNIPQLTELRDPTDSTRFSIVYIYKYFCLDCILTECWSYYVMIFATNTAKNFL
jgi:hypothetical protein